METKVTLFGEEIILDKIIYVSLDNSWELFDLFPEALKDFCYVGDYRTLCQVIKENRPSIITPITKCVNSSIMGKGYDIIIQSENKAVKLSELLMGDCEKSFGRQIRETQNWEKMLYSGCFDLKVNF